MEQTKTCTRCKQTLALELFGKQARYKGGRRTWCRFCHSTQSSEHNLQLRLKAIEMLGGRCAGCDIADARVLCIDHKLGNGGEDRRNNTPGRIYRRAAKQPHAYQVLCFNCNHLKRVSNREYGNAATLKAA